MWIVRGGNDRGGCVELCRDLWLDGCGVCALA